MDFDFRPSATSELVGKNEVVKTFESKVRRRDGGGSNKNATEINQIRYVSRIPSTHAFISEVYKLPSSNLDLNQDIAMGHIG